MWLVWCFIFRELVPSFQSLWSFYSFVSHSFSVILKIYPIHVSNCLPIFQNSVLFCLAQSKFSSLLHFPPWWTVTSLYYIRIYPLYNNSTSELADLTHSNYCLRLNAKNFLLPLLFPPLTPQQDLYKRLTQNYFTMFSISFFIALHHFFF